MFLISIERPQQQIYHRCSVATSGINNDQTNCFNKLGVASAYAGDKSIDLECYIRGQFQIILISPECLVRKSWRVILRSELYQEHLVGIVVDDLIKSW